MSYEIIKELITFRDVVNHYKEEGEGSWLFLSTEGFHGSDWTLADCERILKDEDKDFTPQGAYITVLILDPKAVSLKWGNVKLKNLQEVEWLRKRVKETLDKITKAQEANT